MKTLFLILIFSLCSIIGLNAQEPFYIAIVIDDFGNAYKDVEEMINVGIPITGAIIPDGPEAVQQMHALTAKGHSVMIHMPMESKGSPRAWNTSLAFKTHHSKEEIVQKLETAMEILPLAKSINNHMGSIGTADRNLMEIYISKASMEGLLVLDSLTTSKSLVKEVAQEQNASFLERDVFLDDKEGIGHVQKSLLEALEIAKKEGYAIAIGHVGPAGRNGTTVKGIRNMIEHLKNEGAVFVTIDELYEIIGDRE